jgi:ribosome-associated toxin RatA of RatAB toxin-antitoxin module
MPLARGVFAQVLAVAALAASAAPAHARLVPAPDGVKPPPAYIPAADPGDVPTTGTVPIPGSDLVRGRASVTVRAPLARVRQTILDFGHYPEFMPHYEACRDLGRTANGGRDVYMRIAAVHGVVKMWARIEVGQPAVEQGAETYRSRFVEGNVKDLQATWRVQRIDDANTRLDVEVFLHPKLPLPASVVNGENVEGAKLAVLAFKARAEGKAPVKP